MRRGTFPRGRPPSRCGVGAAPPGVKPASGALPLSAPGFFCRNRPGAVREYTRNAGCPRRWSVGATLPPGAPDVDGLGDVQRAKGASAQSWGFPCQRPTGMAKQAVRPESACAERRFQALEQARRHLGAFEPPNRSRAPLTPPGTPSGGHWPGAESRLNCQPELLRCRGRRLSGQPFQRLFLPAADDRVGCRRGRGDIRLGGVTGQRAPAGSAFQVAGQ